MEGLFGFRKQGGQSTNIQIFVFLEADVIAANSQFTEPASLRLYQGGAIFHDRQIDADVVLLQRNPTAGQSTDCPVRARY